MTLTGIQVQYFRNFSHLVLSFDRPISVVLAPNASGKSNLIEAIRLLSTGESDRAKKIDEMIAWNSEFARVSGTIHTEQEHDDTIEVLLTRGVVNGVKVQKRKVLLNGVARRRKELHGKFPTVLFRPEDMELISGSPAHRRAYLDDVLSQGDSDYAFSLEQYQQALKRRNALLDVLREGRTTRASFAFWDATMIKHGGILHEKRSQFLEWMQRDVSFPISYQIQYDSSQISEDRLRKYADAEVAVGYTMVGPHKDEIRVEQCDGGTKKEIALYGSRGEQRMCVIWLKIVALTYLHEKLDQKPMLLLDDVFSELDERHQSLILPLLQMYQTILTTSNPESVEKMKDAQQIQLNNGAF